MVDGISILTWNLNGETRVSNSQLDGQLEFIEEHCSDVDLFLFQAVRNQDSDQDGWDDHLNRLIEYFDSTGYHLVHTGDWARELYESNVQPHADITGTHNRCNVIVSRWPIERQPLDIRNKGDRKPAKLNYYYSNFPEKILVGEVDTSADDAVDADYLEVWNTAVINGSNWGEEKVNMLETIYGRIHLQNEKGGNPVVLGGDFNAPEKETSDGEIAPHGSTKYTKYPFYGDPHYLDVGDDDLEELTFGERWRRAERRLFDTDLGDWDMRDAYLSLPSEQYEASTEDYTHVIHNGDPSEKRLDHILVSEHFSIEQCEIWNGRNGSIDGLKPDGSYVSDHAPVFAKMEL
jgi:exonuclease III